MHARAKLLSALRVFFAQRSVLEVDPPLLAKTSVTDVHIESIKAQMGNTSCYLQTSPEFFMKRMLASGLGDIYALTKAFRDSELGSRHNPEFTLLEWYRVGWDEFQLIEEIETLISAVYAEFNHSSVSVERLSYADCFVRELQLDPHTALSLIHI